MILPWFYLQKAPLSLQRVSEKPENHRSELLLKYHRFAKFLLKYQDFRSTPPPQGHSILSGLGTPPDGDPPPDLARSAGDPPDHREIGGVNPPDEDAMGEIQGREGSG